MVRFKGIQVDMVHDHFWSQSGWKPDLSACAMRRIRHCVECPKCLTRYVVSCNPYGNSSVLQPVIEGCWDEYTLYCRCKAAASWWKSSEFMICEISAAAFERGYGTAEEITPVPTLREQSAIDVSRYVSDGKKAERRRD